MYGSQTGNSEMVGKDLAEKLTEDGVATVCHPMNEGKKLVLKEVASFLIIICATTGNGDAPENADLWWRSIKLRSAVSDITSSEILLKCSKLYHNSPLIRASLLYGGFFISQKIY